MKRWWRDQGTLNAGIALTRAQQEAVVLAGRSPVLVLTGGPGCGKTFTTRIIYRLWRKMSKNVALCAPTGGQPATLLIPSAPFKFSTFSEGPEVTVPGGVGFLVGVCVQLALASSTLIYLATQRLSDCPGHTGAVPLIS